MNPYGLILARMLPHMAKLIDEQIEYEQAIQGVAMLVGPALTELYVAEAERRVAFDRDRARVTPQPAHSAAQIVRNLCHEIMRGDL